jgi:hypothetical protein
MTYMFITYIVKRKFIFRGSMGDTTKSLRRFHNGGRVERFQALRVILTETGGHVKMD